MATSVKCTFCAALPWSVSSDVGPMLCRHLGVCSPLLFFHWTVRFCQFQAVQHKSARQVPWLKGHGLPELTMVNLTTLPAFHQVSSAKCTQNQCLVQENIKKRGKSAPAPKRSLGSLPSRCHSAPVLLVNFMALHLARQGCAVDIEGRVSMMSW